MREGVGPSPTVRDRQSTRRESTTSSAGVEGEEHGAKDCGERRGLPLSGPIRGTLCCDCVCSAWVRPRGPTGNTQSAARVDRQSMVVVVVVIVLVVVMDVFLVVPVISHEVDGPP